MAPSYVRKQYMVYGRVQGVGFRRFVLNLGQKQNLGGWVKNNIDGTVSFEVCGNPAEVASFIEEVKKGSFFSRVDEIEELLSENREEPVCESFSIKF